MAQVQIYIERHGLKDPKGGENAQLTQEGRGQVAQAALNHLTNVCINAIYSSRLDRAAETAQIAYASVMNSEHEKAVDQREELGFLNGPPLDEYGEGMKKAKAMLAKGAVPTIAQWQQWVPRYMEAVIPRFTGALRDVAIEMATEHGDESVALIGCHSPLTELAVPEKDFVLVPAFQEAGIMRYDFAVDLSGATEPRAILIGYEVIFGGFLG